MTLTIKLDGNWSSFQLANSTPPLCVTDSAIAPSARMANSSGQAYKAKTVLKQMPPHVLCCTACLAGLPVALLAGLPVSLLLLRVLIVRPKPRSSWSGCHSSVMFVTPHRHEARVQVMPPVPRNPAPLKNSGSRAPRHGRHHLMTEEWHA